MVRSPRRSCRVPPAERFPIRRAPSSRSKRDDHFTRPTDLVNIYYSISIPFPGATSIPSAAIVLDFGRMARGWCFHRNFKAANKHVSNYERGQRRIGVLELLRIIEALKGDARAVFMHIVARRAGPKRRYISK
jgi:hypothetical protein